MGSPQSTEYFKDYSPKLVLNEPLINELAKKYNKNAGQVLWLSLDTNRIQYQDHLMLLKACVSLQ